MSASSTTAPAGVALLERAIGYTRTALGMVEPGHLDAPTPCSGWSLGALLVHLDDSLAAFTEAAELGVVALAPPTDPGPVPIVDRIRSRACDALAAWSTTYGGEVVRIGRARLDASFLAAVGSLEIAVHGWDVAQACGQDHPLPPGLALALLDVAPDVVTAADRPHRFAAPRDTDVRDPAERLLAFLGR